MTAMFQDGVLICGPSAVAAVASLQADAGRIQRLSAAGRRRVETTHNWTRAAAVVDATLDGLA